MPQNMAVIFGSFDAEGNDWYSDPHRYMREHCPNLIPVDHTFGTSAFCLESRHELKFLVVWAVALVIVDRYDRLKDARREFSILSARHRLADFLQTDTDRRKIEQILAERSTNRYARFLVQAEFNFEAPEIHPFSIADILG